jgi:hypothetical protein
MPAIVEFPTVVKEAVDRFGSEFANEPERRHFAEYLTGLMVAERKNVSAISRQFAVTTDQSCLNRWLGEVGWDADALNKRRLAWLQEDPACRYGGRGVIPIDNVLVDHDGKLIDDVGWFWDHAEGRYKVAHDYLIVDYVCPGGKHYPLEFRRFVKRDQCEATGAEFRDHGSTELAEVNVLFRELVDWVVGRDIPGDFTFDCWFTHADNLNHVHGKGRAYVGDLKFNRKVRFMGEEMKAEAVAGRIPPADRKKVRVGDKSQWYFTRTVRIDGVGHPVRLVILWERWNAAKPCKILVTNRTGWEVTRVVSAYRHRGSTELAEVWTGTECFHRDGKQSLGMGDCQLRNGLGQTRHMYLVFLAYSLLERQLEPGRASAGRRAGQWATQRLTTIGQACRAVLTETLRQTIDWVVQRARVDQWSCDRIKSHLALT